MGKLRFDQVDVFTANPFGGNPVVVVLDPGPLTGEQMQRIARGMSVAETSFVLPATLPAAAFAVRGFTPTTEVTYSGHQLLGAAWVMADAGRLATGVGRHDLVAEMGGRPWRIAIDRAAERVAHVSLEAPPAVFERTLGVAEVAEVAEALSIAPAAVLQSGLPLEVIDSGLTCLVVPVDALATVRGILPVEPAIDALLQPLDADCLVAFSRETLAADCQAHVRVFATPLGVAEDPATGAAAGALAAYGLRHGQLFGPSTAGLRCEQGTEMGRPSRLEVRLADDGTGAAHIGGEVARSAQGTLFY